MPAVERDEPHGQVVGTRTPGKGTVPAGRREGAPAGNTAVQLPPLFGPDSARGDEAADSRFAPLHIPPHRRLQTFAILAWTLLMPLCVMLYFYAL